MAWLVLILSILIFLLVIYLLIKRNGSKPIDNSANLSSNILSDIPLRANSPQNPDRVRDKEIILRKLKALLDSYLKFGPYEGIAYESVLYPKLEQVADCILSRISPFNSNSQLDTELCFQQGLEWSCGFQEVLDQVGILSKYLQTYGMNFTVKDPYCADVTVTDN